MNMHDEDTTESHIVHSQAHSDADVLQSNNGADEVSCSHCCHLSSHMTGFISQFAELPEINGAITLSVFKEHFHSLVPDPPFQPPQA